MIRSTDCWIDHKLLCANINMKMPPKPVASKTRPRFTVSRLRNSAVREAYSDAVLREVNRKWNGGVCGEEKWKVIKEGMCKAAALVLGQEKRRQPDWFCNNSEIIEPLIRDRNTAFAKWLRSKSARDRQKYVSMRRKAAREVKRCKNTWFQEKANEIERAVRREKGGWKEMREQQRGRVGLHPVRPRSVRDQSGSLCTDRESTQQRWHQHF